LELAALAGVAPLDSELPHWELKLSKPTLWKPSPPELMLPERPFAPLDEQRRLVVLRRESSLVVWKLSAALLAGQPPELLAPRSVLLVAAAWVRRPKGPERCARQGQAWAGLPSQVRRTGLAAFCELSRLRRREWNSNASFFPRHHIRVAGQ
jgi:hypothetical protein